MASCCEDADCNQLNSLFPSEYERLKQKALPSVLVYPLWAAVEIWWCNMTDSVDEEPLPI